MGDMLSQAEIDALLNGTSSFDFGNSNDDDSITLSTQEIDALGEIGNINMGTSATTLFTLLGQKVLITTPIVTVTTWDEMAREYTTPHVAVKVEYTNGLTGTNMLVLKENDVKVITDLMMGGEGSSSAGELTDLHLSAISEAMNQMVGSSATSMSSMFDKRIDISPPKAFVIDFKSTQALDGMDTYQKLVKVAFKIEIGNIVDSEIMQLIPINFAKDLVENLLNAENVSQNIEISTPAPAQQVQQQAVQQQPVPQKAAEIHNNQVNTQQEYLSSHGDIGNIMNEPIINRGPISVQPAQFQTFDEGRIAAERKNISLIMDVPLQVTVELGRTHKLIKDILEFGPGSIIELDKLAGEPVDILVNGKPIAKGEVVVIDESFGVRVTDIIHPSKRL